MTAFKGFLALATSALVLIFYVTQVQGAKNGHYVPASPEIEEQIEVQKTSFHWHPYKRIIYRELEEGYMEVYCKPPGSSIEEFPQIFDRGQRLQGWIVLHFFTALYLFIVLAFICDKYFLPSVERICEVLKISPDVAASTFMATATTMPEFFANTISVFVAESDMGLGAIMGSMLFNTLGVAASASLFTKKPIQIDWWPITRDSLILSFNISILVIFTWDGAVMWWETMILLTLYVLYWLTMFQNARMMKFVKGLVEDRLMWCQRIKNYDIINQRPKDAPNENGSAQQPKPEIEANRESYKPYDNHGFEGASHEIAAIQAARAKGRRQSFDISRIDDMEEEEFKIFEIPRGVGYFDIFWFFFTWPIRALLAITIPNPIKHKKWFPLSFAMCIVWMAGMSYVVFWMVVVIGDTFGIPEPIMGFTLLAFGGCMPEAISAVIVARTGSGQMGVSNALGANSLAVLFSLGLPWFIRTMADGAWTSGAFIKIAAEGVEYTIIGIIVAVASLYIVIAVAGYKLRKTVGGILALLYVMFATLAILSALGILGSAQSC